MFRSLGFWVVVAGLAFYVMFGLIAIREPGLYMDAVDPDFLVVHMADPASPTSIVGTLPGNLLFGRLPILSGLYAGSYPTYATFPFYFFLGGTIISIRLAHLCLGLATVLSAMLLLRYTTQSLIAAGVALLALATDPAFLLPLRTQANITAFPVFFTLAALYVLYTRRTSLGCLIAGILLGLSAFGYFVFLFAIPGIALFVLLDAAAHDRRRLFACLVGGLAVGMLPYVLGYGLILGTLGFQNGIPWIHGIINSLHVNSPQPSYFDRALSVLWQMWLVCTGEWEWLTFWGLKRIDYGQVVKTIVLLALPLLAVRYAHRYSPSGRAFALVGLATASFVAFATPFGSRLGGHDLVAIVPMLYVTAAVAATILLTRFRYRWITQAILATAAMCVLLNASATTAALAKLLHDGGTGLYSDIISRYPQMALARHDKTAHVFWEWGGLWPFIYLTEGRVPAFDRSQLQQALRQYGKVKLVMLGSDAYKSIAFSGLGVKTATVEILRDKHSDFPYKVVTLTPRRAEPALAALPRGTRLPAGIRAKDLHTVKGVFPSSPATCCLLGASAEFELSIPLGANRIAFTVYIPQVPRAPLQQLTVRIDGKTVARARSLAPGKMATIWASVPVWIRRPHVARVELLPSFSFVPNDVGINQDTNRYSVVLIGVLASP